MHAALSDAPSEHLRRRQGRASVLLPAVPTNPAPTFDGTYVMVFVVPLDTPALLASLVNDLGDEVAQRTFLSYGHASVVLLLRDMDAWWAIEATVRPHVMGLEIWSLDDGHEPRITTVALERPPDSIDDPSPLDITDEGLSFEASAQVRQFNANLAVLGRTVRHYAPETWPLIVNLHERVTDIVQHLRELARASDPGEIRKSVVFESVLVETNAVTTLYCSQLGSGTLPIGRSRFPVGEYSLLGIGLPLKAAWRLYFHLSRIFADNNHVGRLANNLPVMGAFQWAGGASSRRDFSAWGQSSDVLETIPAVPDSSPRLHIPYFSSRWGFHESLHSISLSWQCISASATKEWNLLTLTHEFLHSQVRTMFAQIFDPDAEDEDLASSLVQRYNSREEGQTALDSIQTAYVDALVVARSLSTLSRQVEGRDGSVEAPVPERLTADYLVETFRSYSELIHEVAVHVLDFRYVYASRESEYVNSIWSSWSLVPSVADRIEYYLLRTLCALSVGHSETDYFDKFEAVRHKLLEILRGLTDRPRPRPAILAAIRVLESDEVCSRLGIEFVGLQYVVQLTVHFLFDSRLNVDLLRDDTATSDGDRFTYAMQPGEYLGRRPESPVGFLLDRFSGYADQGGDADAEFTGMWQMLQLV